MLDVNTQKGVLLMNLLVSFGIIALLSAMAIPFIRNYQPSMKLSSTARNLTSDLRLAQALSISEQILHLIALDESGDEYSLLRVDASTTTLKTIYFDSEISFQSIAGLSNNEVRFNSYGAAYESGEIIIENSKGDSNTISVKPSGYVQLVE